MFDKWMFVLRNLSRLMERPASLQERIFTKIFEQAEIARYTPEEYQNYEESKKVLWDNFSTLEYAVQTGRKAGREEGRKEGREEGREQERTATALRMKADGLTPALIAKYTGLTPEEITKL